MTCEQHSNLEKSLQDIGASLQKIEVALLGDLSGNKGLLSKIDDLEKRVSAAELEVDTIKKNAETKKAELYKLAFKIFGGFLGGAGAGAGTLKIVSMLTGGE
jgi:chaperonin cofactor prefoldin